MKITCMKNLPKTNPSLWALLLAAGMVSCLSLETEEAYTPEKEMLMLNDYVRRVEAEGYNVDTTALGVFYIRVKEGTGPFPEMEDTLSVKYAGYLINGAVFNTSFSNMPDSAWSYIYGQTITIRGWEEMMALMNQGCRMEFIVPSTLGYGDQWVGNIPPYSTLIFVADMLRVGKKSP